MKKKLYIGVAVIAIIIALYIIISPAKDPLPLEQTLQKDYVAAEGKVEAMPGFEVQVGSELISRVERMHAAKGESVEKGQVLLTLEGSDLKAKIIEMQEELKVAKARLEEVRSGARLEEIKKAAAQLESAKAEMELKRLNLERYSLLYGEGVAPKSMLDEKENEFKVGAARLKQAESELRLLEGGAKEETVQLYRDGVSRAEAGLNYYRSLFEKTTIKSPISGTIIERFLEEGEAVVPETPILTVADTKKLWVNAEVDETDIGRIKEGYPVEVRSDAYADRVFKGEIIRISDYVGARKIRPNDTAKNLDMKVIQVKIGFKEDVEFKIGMTVDVRILPKK